MEDNRAQKILKTWNKLQADRYNFDDQWQEISELVMPNREFFTKSAPGENRRTRIFDNTGGEAHDRLVGQIYGLLTNPAITWFDLQFEDPSIALNRKYKLWLDNARDQILAFFNRPEVNFYPALSEFYDDLCGFGTGILYGDVRSNKLRYRATPLSHLWIQEDAFGQVDTVYRKFMLSARQAKDYWDKVPEDIEQQLENDPDKEEEYLQIIGPRTDYSPGSMSAKGKRFYSIVIRVKGKDIVHEGGYDDQRFMVARWKKASGEKYGRGPGMIVLQEMRMVNAMARSGLVAAEKQADPPVQMPDSGFMGPARLQPGGINYYRLSAGGARIEPINTGARADIAENAIDRHRQTIRRGFFNDLFELPEVDRMTATEVVQRQQERMQMFSPTLIRLYNEMLNPAIKMAYNHLVRQGMLDPPPGDMPRSAMKISYTSPMARSQKASEPGGFSQWMAVMSPLASVMPEVLDSIHPDRMGKRLAEALSVPAEGLRTDAELSELRQARTEAMQQQQEVQAAQGVAKAARDGAGAISDLR